LLNIKDIEAEFIHKLNRLFQENKGDNTVSFEIMELEKIKRIVEATPEFDESEEESFGDENEETTEAIETKSVTEVEEIKVVTKLSMPSRKLKVQISNELLFELEKMQINFKLN
jgi:DNA polymerase-3 subunit alpha